MANNFGGRNSLYRELLFAPGGNPGASRYSFRPSAPAPIINARAQMATPNLSMSPAHDWSGFDSEFHPKPIDAPATVTRLPASAPTVPQSTFRAAPADIHGSAVQGMLDRASGVQPTTPTNTGTSYGTGSVRFDKGVVTPSAPIVQNGQQVGVGRTDTSGQPFNINTARANLFKAYPEVFQAGTPENKAFIAHANQYGEQSAHENAQNILAPIAANKAGSGPGEAQSRSELPAPGSTDAQLSQNAITANTANPVTGIVPNSTIGRAASAVTGAGNFGQDLARAGQNAVSSLGISPQAQRDFLAKTGGAIRNGVNDVANLAGSAWNSMKSHVADLLPGTPTPGLATPAAPANTPASPPAQTVDRSTLSMPSTPTFGPPFSPTPRQPAPVAPAPTSNSADSIPQFRSDVPASVTHPAASMPTASTGAPSTDPNFAGGFIPRAPMKVDRRTLSMQPVPNMASGMFPDQLPETMFTQGSTANAQSPQAHYTPSGQDIRGIDPMSNEGIDYQQEMRTAQNEVRNYAGGMLPKTARERMMLIDQNLDRKSAGRSPSFVPPPPEDDPREGEDHSRQIGSDTAVENQPEDEPHAVGNYAGGLAPNRKMLMMLPPAMQSAMGREKTAIAHGVGGAKPGDKPEPVQLPGVGPAVINTGEKVVNGANGLAVVNRKMLMMHGVPNHAGGAVMIQPSHRGRLHRALGIPPGQTIPAARIAAAKRSSSPALRKQATFAQNFAH